MQFAGECGHPRSTGGALSKFWFPMLTGSDFAGLQLHAAKRAGPILPSPAIWTLLEPKK